MNPDPDAFYVLYLSSQYALLGIVSLSIDAAQCTSTNLTILDDDVVAAAGY